MLFPCKPIPVLWLGKVFTFYFTLFTFFLIPVYGIAVCLWQAGGARSGEYQVKNYVLPSSGGGYKRRSSAATSTGAQLNITNYNLPITVSYLNYLKQRKVC